jgi:hypothetical protein
LRGPWQLRLNHAQLEQKEAAEAAVEEVKAELAVAEDDSKKELLKVELADREEKLDALMEGFAVSRHQCFVVDFCNGGEGGCSTLVVMAKRCRNWRWKPRRRVRFSARRSGERLRMRRQSW